MADFPTMPLRTDALIGDTMHLSAAEFGGYVRLLVAMWRNGATLPDDDARLMRFAGMSAREWRRSRDVLMEFMTRTDDGQWTQKRLRKEWLSVTAKCEQAARSANARWLKEKEAPDANASPPQCERNATHDPVSKETTSVVSITPRKRVEDEPAFSEFWAAYPRQVSKGSARKAFAAACRKAPAETIIAAARRVEDRGQYTPHPATWLNGERWTDQETRHEPDRSQQPRRPGGGQSLLDAAARASARFRTADDDQGGEGGTGGGGPAMDFGPRGGPTLTLLAFG